MINYLDITERNIITFVIKDLIKMAQARYLDDNVFKIRMKEFMTTLDLYYAYPSNSIVCDKVAEFTGQLEYDHTMDLSEIISMLHSELCKQMIYGNDTKLEIVKSIEDFKNLDFYKTDSADINVLIYLLTRLSTHLVIYYGQDVIDPEFMKSYKNKLVNHLMFFTGLSARARDEVRKTYVNIIDEVDNVVAALSELPFKYERKSEGELEMGKSRATTINNVLKKFLATDLKYIKDCDTKYQRISSDTLPHIMKGFSLENLEGDAVHVGYHYIEDKNGVVKEVVAANKSGTDDFISHQFKPEDTTADVIKIIKDKLREFLK